MVCEGVDEWDPGTTVLEWTRETEAVQPTSSPTDHAPSERPCGIGSNGEIFMVTVWLFCDAILMSQCKTAISPMH